MNVVRLEKLFSWLTTSFIVIVLWLVTAFLLVVNKDFGGLPVHTIALSIGLVGIAASWVFIVTLWKLARVLNRSSIVWVGLSIIFGPIGLLVSYYLMREMVLVALKTSDMGSASQ